MSADSPQCRICPARSSSGATPARRTMSPSPCRIRTELISRNRGRSRTAPNALSAIDGPTGRPCYLVYHAARQRCRPTRRLQAGPCGHPRRASCLNQMRRCPCGSQTRRLARRHARSPPPHALGVGRKAEHLASQIAGHCLGNSIGGGNIGFLERLQTDQRVFEVVICKICPTRGELLESIVRGGCGLLETVTQRSHRVGERLVGLSTATDCAG